jgi:hypothetical protein
VLVIAISLSTNVPINEAIAEDAGAVLSAVFDSQSGPDQSRVTGLSSAEIIIDLSRF